MGSETLMVGAVPALVQAITANKSLAWNGTYDVITAVVPLVFAAAAWFTSDGNSVAPGAAKLTISLLKACIAVVDEVRLQVTADEALLEKFRWPPPMLF